MFNEFDEFDLALALYFWLQHNWDGMNDPLYAAFCQLTSPGMFNPGMGQSFDNMDGSANEVYHMLDMNNYQEALDRVIGYVPMDERA